MAKINYFEMGAGIPKVIYQTCPSKDLISDEIQENIRKIRQLNKNWEYCLYDDADIEAFILEYYGSQILKIYKKINFSYGAARADFFRYLLMYAKGGVYLDLKSTVIRPLDEVIDSDDRYLLSKWDNHSEGKHPGFGLIPELAEFERGEYLQWHICAARGHPFLRAVIEQVIYNIQNYNKFNQGTGLWGVLRTTGPIPYTLAIESVKPQHHYREAYFYQEFGVEYSIYENKYNSVYHYKIFGKHYSELKSPVVIHSPFKSFITAFFHYSKKIAKYVKRKLFGISKSKN